MATASPKTLVSIRGRAAYLGATIKHWPELLRSTPWQVWRGASPNARPETFREMKNASGYEQNCEALELWAVKHGIRDNWIWDAAVQTLMNSATGSAPTAWLYVSPELPIEPLAMTVGH